MFKRGVDHNNSRLFFRLYHVVQFSSTELFSSSIFKCGGNYKREACLDRSSFATRTEMGLQKIDMPNFDGSLNVKDKRCAPAIDILSNFQKEMSQNGTNFERDYEEFLKIMAKKAEKTDAAPAAALTNGQTFTENNDMSSLERVLLNQVEALEGEHNNIPPPAENTAAISYSQTSDETRKKCLQMERRIDRLTRRLKLKQSKLYGLHTSEQISGLIDFCRCKIADLQPAKQCDLSMDVYLKRLKRCSDQSCVSQNSEKFVRYFGSGSKESKSARNITMSVAPKFDMDVHEHIEKISGELHAQVKAITNDFDSDVTASSSGNNSLDEETPLPPEVAAEDRTRKLPLNERALWRWMRNRATIAYRLSWLQSRMSALEYKIHHYTEIYKKLRCPKGLVVADQHASSSSPTVTTTTSSSGLSTPVRRANAQVVLNGYHGSLTAVASSSPVKSDADGGVGGGGGGGESDDTCSRTVPIAKGKFRKKNLIRLDMVQQAASVGGHCSVSRPKYSSVRCECVPPVSCVLCATRGSAVDLSYQHIYSNLLPVQSKIALLDAAYHPVLSFPSDVSVSTHIGTLLNNEDVLNVCDKTIQTRTAPPMPVKRYYSNYKSTEEIRRANSGGVEFKRRRKYNKRQPNNKSQNIAFGRTGLGKRRYNKLDKAFSLRKRLPSKRHKGTDNGLDESPDEGLYYKKEKEDLYSSQPGSPHSSHSSTFKDPIRRKMGQSYDIDNFIIPPNSTPVAIVSKPQYKEISIPTWKIFEEKIREPFDRKSLPAHILEDLSDENITNLHEILEQCERKKFRPNATRLGRSRRRTDSCPETSETNTPERVASPPVSTACESNDAPISSNVTAAFTSSQIPSSVMSKNKILASSKKYNMMDCDNSSVTDTTSPEVAPYECRQFPLTDEEYKELLAAHLSSKAEDIQSDVEPENEAKPSETPGITTLSPFNEPTDSDSEDPDDPDWRQTEADKRITDIQGK